jgi:glycosyltransferase involved in cell wall biosynthesis
MSASAARISVCLATLNGERFIEPQVQSILLQLRSDDELVVSDDGSTDATLDKVRSFSDARVRVLLSRERGVATNFEHALRHATGDYIFLADQDDVWLPGKVEVMCSALADKVLAVSDCKVADAELRVVNESYFALVKSGPGFLRNLFRNTYLGCCMAFRRELLDLALPIPRGVAHDYWIGMVAELFDHPVFVPRPLLLYRRHRSAASYAAAKSQRRLDTRLAARWVLAMQLAKRLPRIRERRG